MQLVDFATRRRVTVIMCTVALLLFGMVSLSRLKVNLLPDLSYPTITIRTELNGAAPLEVENLITRPVEEAAGIIRNVRQVRSVSRAGQSDVTLEFTWGTDMDFAGIEVREKLDLLQLPLEATRPLILRFDPSSEPVLRFALLDTAPNENAIQTEERQKSLRRFAEDRLKPDIESVEGTAAVKVSGGLEDEIQIFTDQEKLAQLNLSIETVAKRIRAENVNLSGGRLEQGSQRYLVRTLNEFQSVEEMANAIITTVDGKPVYLRDIADVRRGYKDREAITRVDGKESIELAVYKEGDANTVQLSKAVQERFEEIRKNLPAATDIKTVYDQAHFIASAIHEVVKAALEGGLISLLVVYCFLRDARATWITAIAIPVSVVGTFWLMYTSKLTLNIMSLGGIALAAGMLVDNAVVVLESIVRRREHGASPLEAAREGTREISMAVVASTFTTICVFFPMVFVTGIAGQLFRDQALTVTFSLLLSLIVAIALVPMIVAGRPATVLPPGFEEKPLGWLGRAIAWTSTLLRRVAGFLGNCIGWGLYPLVRATQAGYQYLYDIYPPVVTWALNHRLKVIGTALALFVGSLAIVPFLGTELIPQLSQGGFDIDIRMPAGTPLDETDRTVTQAQRAAARIKDVALTYSVAGSGNRLDANPVDAGENTGKLSITLQPGSKRSKEDAVMAQLRESMASIAGAQYQFSRPSLFTFSNPLEVEIAGYDLERLRKVADAIKARMIANGRFADIKSTIEAGNPEIQIVFDQERAAQLGLQVRDVADRVVASVRGELATRYKWRDKKIDVLVRSVDTRSASLEEVRNLIVNPGSDRPVPLVAVADVKLATGPAEIRRSSQERVAIISADLAYGDLGGAKADLRKIVDSIEIPGGLATRVAGQAEEFEEAKTSLIFAFSLAIFLVYLVMASQFESLLHPFVIMFTIPLAVIGAIWALFITGTTVNVIAALGIIMLAGIVTNNAIVLLDAVNQARARGMDKITALVVAGRTRLRPILITKLTTILGLLPMALGLGEGAEIRAPMAITVIGGLTIATFLTLIVIPVVYASLDRKADVVPAQADAAAGTAAAST
ncbi:MAG TPA: efflux RND transporter permease subunit [Steroidobacteraceae bacterium]|nr:efflux RND transporter permease subunit [Steroidobacteraceae bacterium]